MNKSLLITLTLLALKTEASVKKEFTEEQKKVLNEVTLKCTDQKEGEKCHLLGVIFSRGHQNEEEGLKFYKLGCENNYLDSCTNAGLLVIKTNIQDSKQYFQTACDKSKKKKRTDCDIVKNWKKLKSKTSYDEDVMDFLIKYLKMERK